MTAISGVSMFPNPVMLMLGVSILIFAVTFIKKSLSLETRIRLIGLGLFLLALTLAVMLFVPPPGG